jgi:hypothetical protein
LSWCVKYGLSIVDRELLGHHSIGQHQSALTYSRDAQARPLSLYQGVLSAIRSGTFDPDSTRSGRFKSKKPRREEDGKQNHVAVAIQDVPSQGPVDPENEVALCIDFPEPRSPAGSNLGEEVVSSSDSERSSSSDTSNSDVSVPEFPGNNKTKHEILKSLGQLDAESQIHIHPASHIVHFRVNQEAVKLKCGRSMNCTSTKLRPPIDVTAVRYALTCKQCFGR